MVLLYIPGFPGSPVATHDTYEDFQNVLYVYMFDAYCIYIHMYMTERDKAKKSTDSQQNSNF